MTQRYDWEALGQAAGEAEKNTAPGLASTRPRDWRPNAGQLARSHAASRRYQLNRALDRKLDETLGPVERKTPEGERYCKCGCGKAVSLRARYTAECKKRVKKERMKSLPGRPSRNQPKMAGDPLRKPVKRCGVCCDLPERREPVCRGCGKPWMKESVR